MRSLRLSRSKRHLPQWSRSDKRSKRLWPKSKTSSGKLRKCAGTKSRSTHSGWTRKPTTLSFARCSQTKDSGSLARSTCGSTTRRCSCTWPSVCCPFSRPRSSRSTFSMWNISQKGRSKTERSCWTSFRKSRRWIRTWSARTRPTGRSKICKMVLGCSSWKWLSIPPIKYKTHTN